MSKKFKKDLNVWQFEGGKHTSHVLQAFQLRSWGVSQA